jgi:putative MATE family efflux protein
MESPAAHSPEQPGQRRLFAFDAIDRKIVLLALPALGALIVEPLYNLTDSAIVGHLGKVPLAGLAVAGAALNVVGWLSAFLELATVSAVSFRRSAGDDSGAGRTIGAAYVLSVAVGLATAAFVELAAPLLASLLGGHSNGPVQHDAVLYLRIAALGLPALLIMLTGTGHLTGLADTRRPLVIALVSNVVNVVLEVALVYGAHLGLAGSAWGTVAAQGVGAALFAVASRRAEVRPARPRRAELRALLADGVPLTIRTAALALALLAGTAIAARLGTVPLGGHQIAMQVWLLLALVLDSLAVPAQVYVSEELGRDRVAAAAEIGRRTIRMGLAAGIVLGILTVMLSPVIPSVFSPNPSVQHQALLALVVCGLQQPIAAAAFVLDGLVLGMTDYATLRRTMLLALFAFAPFALLTLAFRGIGLVGIWLGITCWLAARALLLKRRWQEQMAVPG